MAGKANIEWTEWKWNFLRGCQRVSDGCRNCYAERQAIRGVGDRLVDRGGGAIELIPGAYKGLVHSTPNGPRWTGEISFHEDILLAPLRRKTPTRWFVNSMSDLFYEKVTDEMINKAFAVMALCPQHTFQILTKRPERMREYITTKLNDPGYWGETASECSWDFAQELHRLEMPPSIVWPFPNVWLGVSVEDQATADERIPLLLDTPAAIRWISAEPLLGDINLTWLKATLRRSNAIDSLGGQCFDAGERDENGHWMYDGQQTTCPNLDWVVVGGESGPRARPCDIAHIRSIVEQCKSAGVPVFVKQLGAKPQMSNANEWDWPDSTILVSSDEDGFAASIAELNDRKGGNPDEWPEDLRVREYPAGKNELVSV